jgi:hypothetical protein
MWKYGFYSALFRQVIHKASETLLYCIQGSQFYPEMEAAYYSKKLPDYAGS